MKTNLIYAAAAIVALLMFGSHAMAGFGGYGKPGHPRADCPQMSGYWASELNLSETQVNQFRAMNEAFTNENNDLREKLYSMHQEMRQMWADPDTDQDRILAKQEEINDLKNRLRINVTEHRIKMRNEILTGEQREKLSQMLQERGPRGDRRDRGYRDRPGRRGW